MALLLVRAKMVLNPRKKAAERSSTALSRLKSCLGRCVGLAHVLSFLVLF